MNKIYLLSFVFLLFNSILNGQTLKGIKICIDPGHGGTSQTDFYRVGIHGEREEWINLRVGKYLEKMLLDAGASVIMTRSTDEFIDLNNRAKVALDFNADLFVSIHHNGTADTSANYPVIYFHGSKNENKASAFFGELLVKELNHHLFLDKNNKYAIVSDYLIFPRRGAAVLRGTYGIPAVIGEASYFTNPTEELRLKNDFYNKNEAIAYFNAIKKFFNLSHDTILKECSLEGDILQLDVNQEAARMDPQSLSWSAKIDSAVSIIMSNNVGKYTTAKSYLLEVLRFFPDNYRVITVYENLLEVLKRLNDEDKYKAFKKRYENYIYSID